MGSEINPNLCPSCGAPNACGVSLGKTECWCMSLKIDREALARIPSEVKDRACICARCAAVGASSEPTSR